MTTSNSTRLSKLLRRSQLSLLTSEVLSAWATAGCSAKALDHEQHEELVRCFRERTGIRTRLDGSFLRHLQNFGIDSNVVAVVGWNVDIEPAVVVPGTALGVSEDNLRALYPDGFVVCDQPLSRLLIVDFDDAGARVDQVRFYET